MSERFRRTATQLDAVFARFGVRPSAVAIDEGITLPWSAVQQLRSAIAFTEGGNRIPFVNALLRCAPGGEVVLRGDEPHHLMRALNDLIRQKTRNDQLDRGQIPGALSGAEVTRLLRKHPQMFTHSPKKEVRP